MKDKIVKLVEAAIDQVAENSVRSVTVLVEDDGEIICLVQGRHPHPQAGPCSRSVLIQSAHSVLRY